MDEIFIRRIVTKIVQIVIIKFTVINIIITLIFIIIVITAINSFIAR